MKIQVNRFVFTFPKCWTKHQATNFESKLFNRSVILSSTKTKIFKLWTKVNYKEAKIGPKVALIENLAHYLAIKAHKPKRMSVNFYFHFLKL